jgi:hypothetical protein
VILLDFGDDVVVVVIVVEEDGGTVLSRTRGVGCGRGQS